MTTLTPATTPEQQLRAENAELRARLEEAEDTLRAIQSGEVEALIVETADGPQVFMLQGLDAESNRFRGEILAQVSDSVIAVDADQRVTYLNAAAERQYRVTADAVLGRNLSEIFTRHWPSPEAETAMWNAVREHGEWHGEIAQRLHDGRELHVESSLTLLRDADGADAGMVAVIRDITERKRSAAELRRVSVLLDTLLRTAPIGFCFLDRDLRYLRINERLAEINGIPAEAHLGRHVSEIVPTLVDTLRAVTGHILATGEAVLNHEFSGETSSAPGITRFWSQSWYPVRDGAGEVLGFGAVVEEITARKQGEEQMAATNEQLLISSLRQHELTEAAEKLNAQLLAKIAERKEAEEKLRESEMQTKRARDYAEATLRTAPIPLLVLRADLRVNTANEAFYKNFKVAPAETEGALIYDLGNRQWNIPKLRELLEEILPKNNFFNNFEITHEFETIGRHTMLLNARRMENEAGQPLQIVLAIEDITDRKKAEEALRVAMEEIERGSRAKDDFLAALSHELRTPLTPVLMTAAALEGDTSLPIEVREQLAMMRRNIELEARLIDDLLDLTRISRGKLQIRPAFADLHQLLEQTGEIVHSDGLGKEVRVVFALEATRHHTMGDSSRLQQVFWNIIKNALKFTPARGSVTVRTRNNDEGQIIVSVTDTGIGIRAKALSQIFEAFEQGEITFQQRFGGLGLGLAISRAIVELHGGEIRAESDGVGQGATFTVTLATVDAPKFVDPAQSTPPALNRSLRLLVVEDHEATLAVLTRLLTRSGHHLTSATSVRDGLAAAEMEPFDAVISDLGLPDGTGFELMEKLRAAHGLRGIALSGYGMDEDLRRSQAAGFGAHLTKPIDFAQLERALEDLMAGTIATLES